MNTTPPSDKALAPSRRRFWLKLTLWIAGSLVALVICLALGLWLWYRSDGDLVAARAYAKSKGIPTTWAERGLVLSPPERIAKSERIAKLVDELPSYESVCRAKARLSLTAPLFSLRIFEPPPEALRQYHASLDPTKVAELMALVDGLGDEPLVLRTEPDLKTMYGEYFIYYDFQEFCCERVVLAERDEVAILCQRQLHIAQIRSPHCYFSRAASISAGLASVVARMNDLGVDGKEIADRLDALADGLVAGLAGALSDEVVFEFGVLAPVTGGVGTFNGGKSPWYYLLDRHAVINPLLIRAGRCRYLISLVDQAVQVADARTGPALVAKMRNYQSPSKELRRDLLANRLTLEIGEYWPSTVEGVCKKALYAHLVAAEIRGEPWPVDWFDPAGKPLRPVERDGKIIGAYTLGIDGVDRPSPWSARGTDEYYFGLYGPLSSTSRR